MIRLLVDDREDKIKNNISFELYKNRATKIRKIHGNDIDIKFLGIDEDGYEIYQGNKDILNYFIIYLFYINMKFFTIVENDIFNIEIY